MQFFSDNRGNQYAYCARCAAGIEVNLRQPDGKITAEYFSADLCYYCDKGEPRSPAHIKHEIADARILLACAQRLKDTAAQGFYTHQIQHFTLMLDSPVSARQPSQAQASLLELLRPKD